MDILNNGALSSAFTLEDVSSPVAIKEDALTLAKKTFQPCYAVFTDDEDLSNLYHGSKRICKDWINYLKGFGYYSETKFHIKKVN